MRFNGDPGGVDGNSRRAEPDLDLSNWFNPFLRHLIGEVERCGGEVRYRTEQGAIVGVLLVDPVGRVATVFTRRARVAASLVEDLRGYGIFSEMPLAPGAEVFTVYEAGRSTHPTAPPLRHRIQLLRPGDVPEVRQLTREVLGPVDDRWFAGLRGSSDQGFVAEIGGRIVGSAWATLVTGHARLHSVAVRPGFRGLGVGRDLVAARLLWSWSGGAASAITEISEGNRPSRRAAEASGFRPVGAMYFATRPDPPDAYGRGAPQKGHFSTVESMSAPQ